MKKVLSQFPCPAKVNRFLHIMGKREDGYHELETLFQFLTFCDFLDIETDENTAIELTDIHLHPLDLIKRIDHHHFDIPKHDLIVQSVLALSQYAHQHLHIKTLPHTQITLTKYIPPGTGLGGGSSNAASTLMALNTLWDLQLSDQQLIDIGVNIGADVPPFLFGQASLARGIGEVLTKIEQDESYIILCLPNVHASTQAVFTAFDKPYRQQAVTLEDIKQGNVCNDLQAVSARLYPQIGLAIKSLEKYGTPTMSGTGAAVFLVCNSKQEAKDILTQLPQELTCHLDKLTNIHAGKSLLNV